jgi:hypothetical protein
VGYREFSAAAPAEESSAAPPQQMNPDAVTQPWPVSTTVDVNRRRQGRLYARIILVIGVLLLAFAAWRVFFQEA